ncbi:transposable element Tcb2 transposase [Trichonephila clavipes]|nr:transposable element Tcb2 transposase [Trichonephila clavipes]
MATRNHKDAYTRGRISRNLEVVLGLKSIVRELGINKSIVSRAWKAFQMKSKTTLEPDVGQHNCVSQLIQQLRTATHPQISWFTVVKRLHEGGQFALGPENCILLTALLLSRVPFCLLYSDKASTEQESIISYTDEKELSSCSNTLCTYKYHKVTQL